MLVLANEEFAMGMMLAGVKNSYKIRERKEAEEILKRIDKKEFIIVTEHVLEMIPELEEYPNLAVFPETIKDFSNIDDLRRIIRNAIGAEVNI